MIRYDWEGAATQKSIPKHANFVFLLVQVLRSALRALLLWMVSYLFENIQLKNLSKSRKNLLFTKTVLYQIRLSISPSSNKLHNLLHKTYGRTDTLYCKPLTDSDHSGNFHKGLGDLCTWKSGNIYVKELVVHFNLQIKYLFLYRSKVFFVWSLRCRKVPVLISCIF